MTAVAIMIPRRIWFTFLIEFRFGGSVCLICLRRTNVVVILLFVIFLTPLG